MISKKKKKSAGLELHFLSCSLRQDISQKCYVCLKTAAAVTEAGNLQHFSKPIEFHFTTAKANLFSYPAPYTF